MPDKHYFYTLTIDHLCPHYLSNSPHTSTSSYSRSSCFSLVTSSPQLHRKQSSLLLCSSSLKWTLTQYLKRRLPYFQIKFITAPFSSKSQFFHLFPHLTYFSKSTHLFSIFFFFPFNLVYSIAYLDVWKNHLIEICIYYCSCWVENGVHSALTPSCLNLFFNY